MDVPRTMPDLTNLVGILGDGTAAAVADQAAAKKRTPKDKQPKNVTHGASQHANNLLTEFSGLQISSQEPGGITTGSSNPAKKARKNRRGKRRNQRVKDEVKNEVNPQASQHVDPQVRNSSHKYKNRAKSAKRANSSTMKAAGNASKHGAVSPDEESLREYMDERREGSLTKRLNKKDSPALYNQQPTNYIISPGQQSSHTGNMSFLGYEASLSAAAYNEQKGRQLFEDIATMFSDDVSSSFSFGSSTDEGDFQQVEHALMETFLRTVPVTTTADTIVKGAQKSDKAKKAQLETEGRSTALGNQDCPLLNLPGEIRNRIYDLVFREELVPIRAGIPFPYTDDCPLDRAYFEHGNQQVAAKCLRIVFDRPAELKLQCEKIPGGQPLPKDTVKWETSLGSLPLVCKTINMEASSVMYSKTTFYFDDSKRLNRFLDVVSIANLEAVRGLHVHVRAYGVANQVGDNLWESKHNARWTLTFAKIAEKMPNLKGLFITMSMRSMTDYLSRAFRSHSDADWKDQAGPLLMLQPLSNLAYIEHSGLNLRCRDFELAQYPKIVSRQFYQFWRMKRVDPTPAEEKVIFRRNQGLMGDMHHCLKNAMSAIGQGTDPDVAFAEVIVVVTDWDRWMRDPITRSFDYPIQ